MHIKSHEEIKENKCDLCEKTFVQNGSLTLHRNTIHQMKQSHKCEYCENSYSQFHNLKKHMDKKHA